MTNNAAFIRSQEIKLQEVAGDNKAAVIDFIQCLGGLGGLGEKRVAKFVKEVARNGESYTSGI